MLIDDYIKPPISRRISLEEYPRKIKTLSIGKVILIHKQIIGLSVYYPPNKDDNYLYMTLLAVKSNFRGRKIGKILIDDMIKIAKRDKSK
ncbi:MAG: GNAT family N-acetyltransferase [Bacteroidota bacterium]|nr:GNAT family N-acetyltransferase [Bacteroidota bacterium]